MLSDLNGLTDIALINEGICKDWENTHTLCPVYSSVDKGCGSVYNASAECKKENCPVLLELRND